MQGPSDQLPGLYTLLNICQALLVAVLRGFLLCPSNATSKQHKVASFWAPYCQRGSRSGLLFVIAWPKGMLCGTLQRPAVHASSGSKHAVSLALQEALCGHMQPRTVARS